MTAQGKLDSVQHVREIVVVSKPAMREVVPSQKLNGEMLEKLNTHSVADALRYFSGIQLKDYGGVGGIKTVNIRSMGTHHLGISYDGVALGNAQNGQIDLGQFSLDNVEEITLYNGQKSAIFQPASDFGNAGSIYIRTKVPEFSIENGRWKIENGKLKMENCHLRFKAQYGSSDMFRFSALWEQRLSETVSSSVSAGFLTASGKYKFRYERRYPDGTTAWDTTAVRQNGDIHAERIEANLFGRLKQGSWQVKGEYRTSETTLAEVTPEYAVVGGVEIGERETQFGSTYRYVADWKGRYGSEARPFVGFSGGYFHDTHWRMSKTGILTWRHELGGIKLSKAKVKLNVSRAETLWAVEAASDDGAWRRVATFTNSQSKAEVSLPEGTNIMVRVCGAGEKGFYLLNYSFEATVGGEPCYRVGRTTLRRKDGTLFKWPDEPATATVDSSIRRARCRTSPGRGLSLTAPWRPTGWRCCATDLKTTNTSRCCDALIRRTRFLPCRRMSPHP